MSKSENRNDPSGLVVLLDELMATGAQTPDDLIHGAPALIDRLAPGEPEDLFRRARIAQRALIAAVNAIGRPRSDALRALYNLDPIPRSHKVALNQTERREKAGAVYGRSGENMRRRTEKKLLLTLALELDYRISNSEGSTRAVNHPYFKPPHQLPPPPLEFYRLARERHMNRNPRNTRAARRPWTQK
ncbi:hypothetical protein [Parafrankia discariae]|uniref:hypothetical protein n=1 Tax=Parafrankia discariae TaxID=365528 RepID=UPI0012B6AB61|nr:hypothetical protein [Parafrankia discariae]